VTDHNEEKQFDDNLVEGTDDLEFADTHEGGDEVGMDVIDTLVAERDEWRDRAMRAAAEAENTKRRAESQVNDARAYAIQRFAKDLLGVSDNLERALQAAPKDTEGTTEALVTGLELVQKSLLSAFASNNLVRVAPEPGEVFDPNLHQAMMEQHSDTVPGGSVVMTLQPGYALFGRTVRAAMVVVAAKGSGPASGGGYASGGAVGGNLDEKA